MNFPKSLLIFCLSVGIFSCQGEDQTDPIEPAVTQTTISQPKITANQPEAIISQPKITTNKYQATQSQPTRTTTNQLQTKSGGSENLNPVSDEVLSGVEKQLEAGMPGKEVTATPTGKIFTPAQVDSIKGTLPGMKRPQIGSTPLSEEEKAQMWDNTMLKQMTAVLDILCKKYNDGTLKRDKKLLTLESGVKMFPVKAGREKRVKEDSYLSIKYVAMTVDGQKFDANFARDRFFRFKMGAGEVIPGIEKSLIGMGEGAKGIFFIPPHLAFGDKGRVGVPPNTEVAYLIALDEIN